MRQQELPEHAAAKKFGRDKMLTSLRLGEFMQT
jgi:hypothetical protein